MAKLQVKDAFDLQIGKTPSRKNLDYWTDGTFDWVSIRDLGTYDRYVGSTKERITQLAVEESGIKPVPPNTLIMSFKLSLGKTAITVEPTYTNEAIMAFIDKGTYPVDLGYMFHQLRTKDWTEGTNRAVMGATLNKKSLSESWILLPSEDEQHEAADALDSVIEKLACVRMLQAKLDQLTKSRFVEMFGDPDSNPYGYKRTTLGSVLSIQPSNGLYKPQKEYVTDGSGVPIVRIDSFRAAGPDYPRLKRLNCSDTELDRFGLNELDIVINRVNSVGCMGKTMLVSNLPGPVVFESNMMRLHSDESRVIPAFLCAQMTSDYSKAYFEDNAKRAIGQASINQTDVKNLPVLAPPMRVQTEYLDFVQRVDKLKLIAQQQIEKLQMLYDSLAQEYFSI